MWGVNKPHAARRVWNLVATDVGEARRGTELNCSWDGDTWLVTDRREDAGWAASGNEREGRRAGGGRSGHRGHGNRTGEDAREAQGAAGNASDADGPEGGGMSTDSRVRHLRRTSSWVNALLDGTARRA